LKELCSELALPLCILFNKSITNRYVPVDWKNANVTAIFKKGTRTDPGNYRPVSLTSIICKILETFVKETFIEHFQTNNLYSQCQHGFRAKRSCVTQLLEVMEDFTQMIDGNDPFDILYFDFRKAFDTVPHERLLIKMQSYGITGDLLDWTRSFLTNRFQKVKVNNSFSSNEQVPSGIPQGSILGPILFTIFINDIPVSLSSVCKIFADDTKIYNSANKNDIVQSDVNKLVLWTETWNLFFNAQKCKVMHIGKNNPNHEYIIKEGQNENVINTCESEKDLGVTFDNDFKFDVHINNVINKANKMIGIIRRTFSYLDNTTFLNLYKALVRSHLEYANCIWSPKYIRQSAAIEKVQRRATKMLPDIKELSYEDRLIFLQLPSLKFRRIRGDLIQAFKIINNVDNIDASKFFTFNTNTTRNSTKKIFIKHCKTNTRHNTFSFRVAPLWNNLTENAKSAPCMNSFKNALDKEKSLLPLKFKYDK